MKKKSIAVFVCGLVLVTLCGCAKFKSDSSTYYTREHVEPKSVQNTVVGGISTYDKLKESLEDIINSVQTDVSLIVVNYQGDILADLEKMTEYITDEYPLGNYGVSSIKFNTSFIASYCEVEAIVTYDRPYDEMSAVVQVLNANDLEEAFRTMIRSRDRQRTLSLQGINLSSEEIEEIFNKAWFNSGYYAYGIKEMSFTAYPSIESPDCIIDTTISLTDSILDVEETTKECMEKAEMIASDCASGRTADKLGYVLDWIGNNVHYDEYATKAFYEMSSDMPKIAIYTAAGALMTGSAAQPGVVITSSVLLDEIGVRNEVVYGTRNGEPYAWLYIKADSEKIHFDPCSLFYGAFDDCIIKVSDADKMFGWNTNIYTLD